jgi:phosphoglycerol transferase MdoB-like AlkP superfamily enzyme
MQLVHGVIARAERRELQLAVAPQSRAALFARPERVSRPPVVLVQAESFFDARRLHAQIPADLLPAFESCRRSSVQWGLLDVRGRGGNTMRTEFDVLTGLTVDSVGLDWRNPYHAFAKAQVDSLAWRLKERGYRTLCIHPFDRRFFDRHRVMPNLGFDEFWGEEAFDRSVRERGYIADREVARLLEELLRDGEGLFVFAITVANHGPWTAPAGGIPGVGPYVRHHGGEQLLGFLHGLRQTDEMLAGIRTSMARHAASGLLAFFGDHLPSLAAPFARLGFNDTRTDYLLWRNGEGQSPQRDCAAHELQSAILGALDLS